MDQSTHHPAEGTSAVIYEDRAGDPNIEMITVEVSSTAPLPKPPSRSQQQGRRAVLLALMIPRT